VLAQGRHSVVFHSIQTIFGSGFTYARSYRPRQSFRFQQHIVSPSPFHPQLWPAKAIPYSVQNGPFAEYNGSGNRIPEGSWAMGSLV
jgi:hypothetical protein